MERKGQGQGSKIKVAEVKTNFAPNDGYPATPLHYPRDRSPPIAGCYFSGSPRAALASRLQSTSPRSRPESISTMENFESNYLVAVALEDLEIIQRDHFIFEFMFKSLVQPITDKLQATIDSKAQ